MHFTVYKAYLYLSLTVRMYPESVIQMYDWCKAIFVSVSVTDLGKYSYIQYEWLLFNKFLIILKIELIIRRNCMLRYW